MRRTRCWIALVIAAMVALFLFAGATSYVAAQEGGEAETAPEEGDDASADDTSGGEEDEEEEEEEEDKEAAQSLSVLDTIAAGGVIGFIIIGLSFVALSLIIEHAVTIRRDKLCPNELAEELQDYFNEERYEDALELCNVEHNMLTEVIRAGLSRIDSGYDRMQEAMMEAGEEGSVTLQQKISYLSLIGNIAPMLGLLGTVAGMVGAFRKIATAPVVKPSILADNIQQALVTTLLGLSVAIPVMCAYQFFSNRVSRIVLEASTTISDMMERFKPTK